MNATNATNAINATNYNDHDASAGILQVRTLRPALQNPRAVPSP